MASEKIDAIVIRGLKNQIRSAFEAGKFMTDGRALPSVDFGRTIAVEVTAVDTLGLFPTLICKDDEVVAHGRKFERQMHLKMVPECTHQDAIMQLVIANCVLAREFHHVKNIRVCLKDYSVANA
ncbi:hypothetical protein HDG34_003360 [Paraburkholderia sp. HC6.4b]|uniref:hypothetical protein n=1 Tax=unclassified Paraburkholderia TaxID=2615204 RepID=UPI00160E9AAB|nr:MULTISPECIES: hypothetical protein [unclassified Paraburkholderia]MBB5409419.1 hypothetical protein [Paraburkholderia sp. HC6.4b]MBB5451149.1 hypothetical protein [Paraburkholderia sp. Kb1A]